MARIASVPASGAPHYTIVDANAISGTPLDYALVAVEVSGTTKL